MNTEQMRDIATMMAFQKNGAQEIIDNLLATREEALKKRKNDKDIDFETGYIAHNLTTLGNSLGLKPIVRSKKDVKLILSEIRKNVDKLEKYYDSLEEDVIDE